MATLGPYFGLSSSGSAETGNDWDVDTVPNVFVADGVSAVNESDGNPCAPIRIIGFDGVSVITDTIIGVQIDVYRNADTAFSWTDDAQQAGATFVFDSDGTYFGADYHDETDFVSGPLVIEDKSYGGPTDMWSVTDSDWKTAFADSTFGFQWRPVSQVGTGIGNIYCDAISITVFTADSPPAVNGSFFRMF